MTPATSGSLLGLARDFLLAVKSGDEAAVDSRRRELAALDTRDLETLSSDDETVAFWVNVYNAFVQYRLEEDPARWENGRFLPFPKLFSLDLVTVAGTELSLDDVEHGLLRRSKSILGFGYLPRLLTSSFEREHRVREADPRVHFALNCGAASCPPIAAYSAANLDEELDRATASFLESECEYDADETVVRVSKLFSWYRGDFGGKAGIVRFLREYGVVPEGTTPKLAYTEYDWSMNLGAYDEERV
ncbi:DUF547 domain-containing protein [Haloarchaeobius sp. TZWWS8]|uniref:DUF547 domain-containing protein n=1 Tax=Haloarchaeobius sp. TZWWS8 TaxID=3446121 RepID=UPI003EBEB772